jgi:2-amino-4-hydroxy-6-hydroxymethyldihydropteridine diphosphokinase
MNRCYLSLGSNQKVPERQIRLAISTLKKIPSTSVTKVSSLYWNKAWGLQTQQDFCNAVVEVSTTLSPDKLLDFCHWGPRTLDIDIIFYGLRTIKTARLTIPHPYYSVRDFVTKPLLQINPNALKEVYKH